MGIIIFIFLAAAELFFFIWNHADKNRHERQRAIVTVGIFLLLFLLSAIGVLEWGFRYYLILIVFMLRSILAVYRLIRKKWSEKPYKTGRGIGSWLFHSILYLAALFPAILFPQYDLIPESGVHTVAARKVTYEDVNRVETYTDSGEYRRVNAAFWYPEDGEGSYPLIIFSHGMYGVKYSNETLFRELASHGYVVCSLDHPYHSFFTQDTDGRITTVSQEYLGQFAEFADASHAENLFQSYDYIQEWMQIREEDIFFMIDALCTGENGAEDAEIRRLVDTESIAVCGHSMGGAAALGIGREGNNIAAVVSLEAPYLGDITGVEDDGLRYLWNQEPYPAPVLNIYSDGTWGLFSTDPTYEQNEKMLSDSRSDVYNVYISGTTHLGLTDLSLFSPDLASLLDGGKPQRDPQETLELLNDIVLNFLDYYVKGNGTITIEAEY